MGGFASLYQGNRPEGLDHAHPVSIATVARVARVSFRFIGFSFLF